MTGVKVLVDMNLSPRWVDFLVGNGLEAVHWSTVGSCTATDRQIMAWAKANGSVVLTHDLDFGAILAATEGDRPSVVQLRAEDLNPNRIGRQVVAALHKLRIELGQGALVTVDAARMRLRLLPLPRKS